LILLFIFQFNTFIIERENLWRRLNPKRGREQQRRIDKGTRKRA